MTIGLSKETLEDYRNIARSLGDVIRAQVISDLLRDCKELDPWLPIDENTPRGKSVLFKRNHTQTVGTIIPDGQEFACFDGYHQRIYPTHYKELPEDPKE